MPREKELYRTNLEFLSEQFPNKTFITIAEAQVIGLTRKTIMGEKTFPKKKLSGRWIIPIPGLASWMS